MRLEKEADTEQTKMASFHIIKGNANGYILHFKISPLRFTYPNMPIAK